MTRCTPTGKKHFDVLVAVQMAAGLLRRRLLLHTIINLPSVDPDHPHCHHLLVYSFLPTALSPKPEYLDYHSNNRRKQA